MPTKLPLLGGGEREPALLLSDAELSCLDYVAGYFTDSKPLVSRLIGSVATKARSAPADSVVVRREVLKGFVADAKLCESRCKRACNCETCTDRQKHRDSQRAFRLAEAEAALKGGE